MFGSIGQNWRQFMQAPQQFSFPVGGLFPTRNASGGWQMGAPSMPQSPAQAPVPQAAPAAQAPMSFMGPSQFYAQPNMPMQPMDEKNRFGAPMMSGWM